VKLEIGKGLKTLLLITYQGLCVLGILYKVLISKCFPNEQLVVVQSNSLVCRYCKLLCDQQTS